METPNSIRQKILVAATQDDPAVRAEYLSAFKDDVDQFVDGMARAFQNWLLLDKNSSQRKRHAHVSALVYSAISLHVTSMNLFLGGWIIAAGNTQRQVLGSIALAFLVADRKRKVFELYAAGKYSSSKAPDQLLRVHANLGLDRESVETLVQAVKFYHNWSHANLMTIATHMSEKVGDLYVASSFDESRLDEYRKEAAGRASLAAVFENFVTTVHLVLKKGRIAGGG